MTSSWQRPTHSQPSRMEYLALLQKLAADCRTLDVEDTQPPQDMPDQLVMLAHALERLEEQVHEIRDAQQSATGLTLAFDRRLAALEQSAPTPQSWRDLVQGIRGIREVVLSQAMQRRQPCDD